MIRDMKTLLLSFFILLSCSLAAQQEGHNTQFMYNKLGYNPGFAGARESTTFTALVRSQWLGLDGAPQTQALMANVPLMNQRVGLGLNVTRFTIGITNSLTSELSYAYRFRLGRGHLGLGLQGSIRSYRMNFSDPRLTSTQSMALDPSIPGSQQQKSLFNFGAGAYYEGERFYIGASTPRLLRNNLDFGSPDIEVTREIQHYYLMGGITIPLGEHVKLEPQALLKYVMGAPFDADFNLSLNFSDKYLVGATYRMGGNSETGYGESIDILVAIHLSKKLLMGVSYDITLSDLKDFNTGSVELVLRYSLREPEGAEVVNPRFF
jgi:type IX secretion system PorP/SprF family membrane protein